MTKALTSPLYVYHHHFSHTNAHDLRRMLIKLSCCRGVSVRLWWYSSGDGEGGEGRSISEGLGIAVVMGVVAVGVEVVNEVRW